MREAQSAGILSHPGIVTIYDVAEQDGLAYISMEYVDGPTLERMMVTDPPDGKLVLEILAQTAAALDYAHKRGIVHRDIKPANIMIHERTIAKDHRFRCGADSVAPDDQAGSMVGTPNYMSPEQIQGQPVDGRSDQFSLGGDRLRIVDRREAVRRRFDSVPGVQDRAGRPASGPPVESDT